MRKKRIGVVCHGKVKQRVVHTTGSGRYYVMERKPGGGVKRKYVYSKRS